ncbi:hypothetical protein LAZ67_23000096 [Cordylochernes scorpioides]|uniref:Uncharacterized protein n=1 Tax=Cordylochernes scorpioides TaxID=51811 RepID=A0ABY6LPN4_9ARAC|nr:hypothetical protein LAZ67_23000096 [Cordylochernes scorpioides]
MTENPQKEEVPAEGRQPPLAQEEVPRPGDLDIPGPITRSRARRLEAQALFPCQLHVFSTAARYLCCQILGSLATGSHVLCHGG